MRAKRAASAALLGVASLALTAPIATAADSQASSPVFSVTPSTVSPGGRVTLSASGCNTTSTASSGVFNTVSISPGSSATVTVDLSARPGAQYSVQFNCPGQGTGSFNLTITGGRSTPTISTTSTAPAGVRGGLGGSIGGLNAGELALGTALVVIAATGTIFVVRRRAEGRRH
ncbi:hypothetical protein FBY35_0924 [Streptomyces sp. SLBN-118]|uniref:hypothetical protein n=1 Tax=Streptomyces sp. SLBN-118 TaxID=2768454 RepID=UPI00115441AA|nr:hypothetical protein [Streptomyces sp. SLBN-118]TQK50587.1 hypothetical protein FBY35_0924 [Streptomyces sp. SLBN-118]